MKKYETSDIRGSLFSTFYKVLNLDRVMYHMDPITHWLGHVRLVVCKQGLSLNKQVCLPHLN